MTTKIAWMYHGVGHGEGAPIVDSEENQEAVARFLVELKWKQLILPDGTKVYLWCGAEYFEFRKFNSEFKLRRGQRGIKQLVFSAECENDGLVRFVWKRKHPDIESHSTRRLVDSIDLWKP